MKNKINALMASAAAWLMTVPVFAEGNGVEGSNQGGNFIISPGEMPSLSGSLEDTTNELNNALDRGVMWGQAIIAVVALILLGSLILNITILAKSGADEKKRQGAKDRLLYNIIAIALLGALGLIAALSRNIF